MSDVMPLFEQEKYLWIKARVAIDLLRVDEDLSEISSLIHQCGEYVALANEIRDTAKDELERAKAEAAELLRSTPLASGKERSESAIVSQIPLNEAYKKKQTDLSGARVDAGLWTSLMESLKTKSFSIRTVADLINSGYLSKDYIMERRRRDIRNVQVGS